MTPFNNYARNYSVSSAHINSDHSQLSVSQFPSRSNYDSNDNDNLSSLSKIDLKSSEISTSFRINVNNVTGSGSNENSSFPKLDVKSHISNIIEES